MSRNHGLTAALVVALSLGIGFGAPASAQYDAGKAKKGGKPPVVVVPSKPQHVHKHHSNKAGNIAAGVAAGVAGAIILNEIAKGSSGGYEDDGLSCRQLERRCDRGQDWACRKYDRRGC